MPCTGLSNVPHLGLPCSAWGYTKVVPCLSHPYTAKLSSVHPIKGTKGFRLGALPVDSFAVGASVFHRRCGYAPFSMVKAVK